jgi:hypothetical protein
VSFSAAGPVNVQATKPGTVRSATETTCVTTGADGACGTSPGTGTGTGGPASAPCVTNGADGRCGTPDRSAPRVRLRGLRDGHRYTRRNAPRTLRGTVSSDASGLRAIQVRLKRRDGRECTAYSGSRERWVTRTCWHNAKWFGVGDRESWSYLLPGRLTRGRYTLDVRAVDGAGNVSSLKRGRSRVVFRVL